MKTFIDCVRFIIISFECLIFLFFYFMYINFSKLFDKISVSIFDKSYFFIFLIPLASAYAISLYKLVPQILSPEGKSNMISTWPGYKKIKNRAYFSIIFVLTTIIFNFISYPLYLLYTHSLILYLFLSFNTATLCTVVSLFINSIELKVSLEKYS